MRCMCTSLTPILNVSSATHKAQAFDAIRCCVVRFHTVGASVANIPLPCRSIIKLQASRDRVIGPQELMDEYNAQWEKRWSEGLAPGSVHLNCDNW
jgi:hypothetical protein